MTKEQFIEKLKRKLEKKKAYWEAELVKEQTLKLHAKTDLEFAFRDSNIRFAGNCIDELELDIKELESGKMLKLANGFAILKEGDKKPEDIFWVGYLDSTNKLSSDFKNVEDVPLGGVFKDLENPSLFFIKTSNGIREWRFENTEVI